MLGACVLTNPLFVIAARVQYSAHYLQEHMVVANTNSLKAFIFLKKTGGVRGMCAGLVPNTIMSFASFGSFLYVGKKHFIERDKE